ncbi:NTF2 fold immunity protein [Dyella sp.]|uniref:NTF2 fold immunity protein n=1 Tax=Dyella sp. TaxID=1869338 RepID=UPI003F8141C5
MKDLFSRPVDTPQLVVESFLHAMHDWEVECARLSRHFRDTPNPECFWPEVRQSLAAIHECFLTPRKRTYAAMPSFQQPPSYDPSSELVRSVETNDRQATVETHRIAALSGGRYLYSLKRLGGRWLIDSIKYWSDNTWKRNIP